MFRYNRLLFTLLVLVWDICTVIDIYSAPNIVDCHRDDSIVLKCLAEGEQLYAEGNYPASLGQYIQGLEISERLCDPSLIAIFYKNMGNVYNMFGDGEKALLLYERALIQNSIDTLTKHDVLMNLVRTAISLDNLEKAKKAYREAVNMKYHRRYMDKFLEGFSHAMIIEKEGKYDRAVKEYVIMADSATKWELDPRFETGTYEQIANSFLRRGINDSALVYMRKYVDIAENTGRTHMFAGD
ncbi:MAG: tetratricopeptide repeat protein [Bacteroides sp.]|nr:tetratricopeptide repeat protein [Bacteroides sp.]